MQSLARNGYTSAEVDAALHAANRTVKFRYDLLTSTNTYKAPLTTVMSASVANNALAQIKRTARFTIRDDGSVNFLSDRIKPYARLLMPDITRMTDNYELSFDGIDDYVDCGLVGDFTELTFECKAYIRSIPAVAGMAGVIGNFKFDTVRKGLVISVLDASINIYYPLADGSQTGLGIAIAPQLNTWMHLAVTYKNRVISVYLNSLYIGGITLTYDMNVSGTRTTIGKWAETYPGYYFDGIIDECRQWNVARTQAQIQANMNSQLVGNESGLVGYWKFDEGTGLTAFDSTANANNGTLTNGPVWVKEGLNRTLIPSSYVEFPLGVFILSTPPVRTGATNKKTREVEAYDLLQVLVDDKVADRYTVSAGTNYIVAVKALLDGAGITFQNLTAIASTLPAARDWPPNTTKLQIVNDLLGAINYRSLYFEENGSAIAQPYVSPATRASEYVYIDDARSVISPDVEQSFDLFGIPNKWILVVGEPDRSVLVSTYTNSNPASPTSTVNRGRTIVDFRTNQEAADQTTLDALAVRTAFEASQVYEIVTFKTAIMPMHSDLDVYTFTYSKLGINAKYSEDSWEMQLKSGTLMSHKIRRVVAI